MLTAEELGVLCVCLHLLREFGSVEISGMGTSARWPRREPPLVAPAGLKNAFLPPSMVNASRRCLGPRAAVSGDVSPGLVRVSLDR
jgi:hypothetical protein